MAALVPWLADDLAGLTDWSQTSLLSVESGRVRRWYRPGLLLIGDAAHVMSPVGGVGIKCAIQDAVATANLVGPCLKAADLSVQDLARVQQAREWQVRLTQACQQLMQQRIIDGPRGLPGLVFGLPWTRRLISQIVALGLRRPRVAGAGLASQPTPRAMPSPVTGQ